MWSIHIRDSIGKERISSLSPHEVEKYFRVLKNSGLSEASVRQIRAILGRACRLARKWSGATLPNPIADAEMPSYAIGDRDEVRAPSIAEVKALMQHLDEFDPRIAAFIRVILATGMRRGEACALRWSDVDFENLTLLVDESVIGGKGSVSVKSPKTRASIRRVAIDEKTGVSLRELFQAQEDLAAFGDALLGPESFVFSFVPGGVTRIMEFPQGRSPKFPTP